MNLCLSDKVLIAVYLARRWKPNTPLADILTDECVGSEFHEIVTELKRLTVQGYLIPIRKGGPFNQIVTAAGIERAEKLLDIKQDDSEEKQKQSALDTVVKYWSIFADTVRAIYETSK
jgi:hypothetical protein